MFCNCYLGLRSRKSECRTTPDSDDPNKPCVFPFEYGGFLFTKCTDYGASDFWCPTKIPHGSFNKKSWGLCESSCPKHQRGMKSFEFIVV